MKADVEKRKRVAVVGATGSVGSSVLDVCRGHRDRLEVVALAAGQNVEKLASLAAEFETSKLCLATEEAAEKVTTALFPKIPQGQILSGAQGLKELSQDPDIDHVVFASSGTAAIEALQVALREGKDISLANKESVVVAGTWVMPLVRRRDQLRPLDSEHNAIWQCLQGEKEKPYKIYLTASGGPFRERSLEELKNVTPEEALKHPVWNMGAKITVDSATLMNKGIELIEAMFLFALDPDQVEALISPGSFAHGLVEFEDGFVKILAGDPDMRLPAASCLFWPERLPPRRGYPRSELSGKGLSFNLADEKRFPALRVAKEALAKGGAYPALLVGADEVAVDRFLNKDIPFTAIAEVVEETMGSYPGSAPRSLDEALEILEWGRGRCASICDKVSNYTA
ncbi:MAG: 1-deoxy-D-xylulose-5-phosphate reductoisomerase [Synergistaceae bacterium]|jgi:1-deoxy-D-xylulose-5-phosphate reductoisomerase|nr:1-deoxy-D-xylulose-5-phosphate reductoisomerase [Synergistaceae bacterium]